MQRALPEGQITWKQLIETYNRQALGANAADTGQRSSAWYYSVLHQTAQAFAQVRFKFDTVRMRDGRPDRQEMLFGPLIDFWKEPYPDMTAFAWRERWIKQLLQEGNVFGVWTGVTTEGLPNELMLVEKCWVQPLWENGITGGRIRGITVTMPNDVPRDFLRGSYIHWKIDDPTDRFWGIPPRVSIRTDLRSDWHRQNYDLNFYARAARPSAVLIDKNYYLDEGQRKAIKEAYEASLSGAGNAGGLAVIPGNFELKEWAFQQSQAQYIDSRKFSREQTAAAMFNFPIQLLASEESGGLSKAELESARLMLYDNCVIPHISRLIDPLELRITSMWNKAGNRRIRAQMSMAIDEVPIIMQSALRAKTEIMKTWSGIGIPNNASIEALGLGLDPYEGGDVGYISGTVTPVGAVNGATIELPEGAQPDEEAGADEGDAVVIGDEGGDVEEAGRANALPAPPPRGISVDLTPAAPILTRLAKKIRATLWGIRYQCLNDPERMLAAGGLDKRMRSDIRHFMPPVIYAAMQLGRDQVKAENSWLEDLDPAEARHELASLQAQCLDPAFVARVPQELRAECEAHVERAHRAFESLAQIGIECVQNGRPDDLRRAFNSVDRMKRAMSEAIVRWAINAGRAQGCAGLDKKPRRWNYGACPVDHMQDRYPGDPSRSFEDILDCTCWVVGEEA
jgi:HK97 family phage portal protein